MDISINADDGTKAISVVQDYLTKMPALRPLVFVIKALLSHKGLNSPANGGLGSYAIICLVICFLQVLYSISNHHSLLKHFSCFS